METLKYNLLHNWNVIRIIRLVLSIIIIVQAIQIHDFLFGGLGLFFLYQAVANKGCCAMNTCSTTKLNNEKNQDDSVEYSEVK